MNLDTVGCVAWLAFILATGVCFAIGVFTVIRWIVEAAA